MALKTQKQFRAKVIANVVRLFVVFVGLLALLAISFSLSQKHRSDREHAVLLGGCHRNNEKQVSENRSQLADYLFFSVTAALLKISARNPTQPQTARQTKQTIEFADKLLTYAEAKEWRHLVENCHQAVENPGYKFSSGIKFLTTIHIIKGKGKHVKIIAEPFRQMPPTTALELQRGE